MVRLLMLAALSVAVLAVLPGAEASCHYCLEEVTANCVDDLDAEACPGSAVHLATHAEDFAAHLLNDGP